MEFKQILGKVAPFLGGLVGGPLGASVGGIVGNLLGVDPSDEKQLASAIQSATPDQLIALKQIDSAERMRMAQLANESYKIEVEDRSSARGMFTQTRNWMPEILSILGVIGVFIVFAINYWNGGHTLEKDPVIDILIGQLSMIPIRVYDFWMGSTSSSKRKDEMLYKSTPL